MEGSLYNLSSYYLYRWQIGTNYRRRKFNPRSGLLFTVGSVNRYTQMADFTAATKKNFCRRVWQHQGELF